MHADVVGLINGVLALTHIDVKGRQTAKRNLRITEGRLVSGSELMHPLIVGLLIVLLSKTHLKQIIIKMPKYIIVNVFIGLVDAFSYMDLIYRNTAILAL